MLAQDTVGGFLADAGRQVAGLRPDGVSGITGVRLKGSQGGGGMSGLAKGTKLIPSVLFALASLITLLRVPATGEIVWPSTSVCSKIDAPRAN